VFPSWHEGFGLPALEAMSCGAAVIGSNTTSVPEVIGNPDALFDPFDETSITEKLNQVLTDQEFRERLSKLGIEQSKKFSWDKTAQTALATIDRFFDATSNSNSVQYSLGIKLNEDELVSGLIDSLVKLQSQPQNQRSIDNLAVCIHRNFPNVGIEKDVILRIQKVVRISFQSQIRNVVEKAIKTIGKLCKSKMF
jgi:hypothetical protein